VLLLSSHTGNPLIDELTDADVPVVTCGKPLGHEHVAYPVADDRAAGASPPSPARRTPRAVWSGSRAGAT
jgi:hypothetical protein